MEIYLTEQEQIDQLKKLWHQYGKPIIAGIVLALALSYGWHYWQKQQEIYRERAGLLYLQMVNNIEHDNSKKIEAQAEQLMNQFPKTPYAVLASLQLAKQAVAAGQWDQAQAKLHWAAENARDPALKELAVLRAARVYIATHKPQQALDILKGQTQTNFPSYAYEITGDAFLAMNKPEQARQAYAKALQATSDVKNTRPLLQMKYDAIPMGEKSA